MQNKKSLLQRLLVIYITFFIVLVTSLAHNFIPAFTRGYSEGAEMGCDIMKSWMSDKPRMIYILNNIPIDDLTTATDLDLSREGRQISAKVVPAKISMIVQEEDTGTSPMLLAFRSLGGELWLYALTMFGVLAMVAIVVLMFLIIHSLRRSIREERTLPRSNAWMLRTIGLLTIVSELALDIVQWRMALRAASLLEGTQYAIDTHFDVSYSTIIMGILVLFAAEVFAIGQNLSEEQKLTI